MFPERQNRPHSHSHSPPSHRAILGLFPPKPHIFFPLPEPPNPLKTPGKAQIRQVPLLRAASPFPGAAPGGGKPPNSTFSSVFPAREAPSPPRGAPLPPFPAEAAEPERGALARNAEIWGFLGDFFFFPFLFLGAFFKPCQGIFLPAGTRWE